jgi:hypothetical protein
MHREQVRQSPWIQCDDTTQYVQDYRQRDLVPEHLMVDLANGRPCQGSRHSD